MSSESAIPILRRRVGVWPIAATIFFVVSGGPYTTEQVVGKSGPLFGLLILCLLPLLWSLPVGLMTAELSSKLPEEGGYYVWVKTAFGPFAGFLCAWWSWTSSWVDLALFPIVAVHYAGRFKGDLSHPYIWVLAIIVALTLWNLLGIGKVSRLSSIILLLLLLPFLILSVLGFARWITHPVHLPLLNPHAQAGEIGSALAFALWNYFGFDSVTTAQGEIQNTRKLMPKALLLGVVLVTAMVAIPVAAGLALKTGWPNWDTDSGYWPEIASAAWPPLRTAIVLGGVISNIGQFSANLLASSRIPFILARERKLPKLFGQESRRFGTPWVGIVTGGIITALLARLSLDKLVAVDLSFYLMALILECAALVALRRKLPKVGEVFEIGGGRIGLLLCALLPIAIGIIAIGLQLNPNSHLAEGAGNPLLIFLILLLPGPVIYSGFRFVKR